MSYALRVLRAILVLGARSRKAQVVAVGLAIGALVLLVRAGSGDSPPAPSGEAVDAVRAIATAARAAYERDGKLCPTDDWACLGMKQPSVEGYMVWYRQGGGFRAADYDCPTPYPDDHGWEVVAGNEHDGIAIAGLANSLSPGMTVADLCVKSRLPRPR